MREFKTFTNGYTVAVIASGLSSVALLTAFVVLVTVSWCAHALADEQLIKPSQEISLADFGYQGLSPLSRFTTAHDLTINFLDHDHLLLTYNPKQLVQRHPECPPSHKDHVIDAKVLDLNSGKVIREKSWYVHDKHAYLWPLGQGRLLLRILNQLYVLDDNLNEKLLLESPQEILWTAVTPDGKQIILETATEDRTQKTDQLKDRHQAKVRIEFLDVQTLLVQRTLRLSGVVALEGTSLGFGDAVRNLTGKIWLVRFGSNSHDRENITRVRSQCVPNLLFPTNNTLLVGRCSGDGKDYNLSVFTVTGHPLWRQRWTQNRYEPALQRSEDGSRVVISSIAGLLPGVEAFAPDSEENAWPRVEQKLHVLNTATGTSVLETAASVILSAQNFSLAPDGSRFAVVDGTSLRLYDLLAMSVDERAKYVAMQADAPTLAAPKVSNKEEQKAAGEDDVFDVASVSPPEQRLQSAPAAPANATVANSSPTPGLWSAPGVTVNKSSPTQAETDANVPIFRASSKTVVVDVVVTDSKGHPVKGLAQADFQIHEDGKPQRINYFHEYTGYAARDSNAHSVPKDEAKLPSNIFSNNQLAREDEPVTVFLLDLLNTAPEDQHLALGQLIQFLKEKPNEAQFALCTLSNQLRLIQGFTPDEQTLIATALGKKGAVRYAPLHEVDTGTDLGLKMQQEIAAIDPAAQSVVKMFQEAEAKSRSQELDQRVYITVDGFAQLARYLSGVPGRKNVIWLSGSFPLGVLPNGDLMNPFNETRNYSELMKKTANLLAEAHVAVYPVDVRGLKTEATLLASNSATNSMSTVPQGPGSATPIPAAAGPSAANPSGAGGGLLNKASGAEVPMAKLTHESLESHSLDQSTVNQIAQDTGGKAFYNTNGVKEAIQTALEQGSEYYMLSYTPSNHNYDGRLRKINVAIAGRGYHLAYRRGYFADDPFSPLKQEKDALSHDVGVASMQHGSPQAHQILFAARVIPMGKPVKVDSPKQTQSKKEESPLIAEVQHYSVDYAIAPSQLQFSVEGDAHHGIFDFMASTFDDDGKALSRTASRIVADLKAQSFHDIMAGGFRVHQELAIPVNAASLRLGIEDELSRKLGTVEIPLPVPPAPDQPSAAKAGALPEIEPD